MMLTITKEDFSRLSSSCQRELLSLLGYREGDESDEGNETIPYEDGYLPLPDEAHFHRLHSEDPKISNAAKRVIDITPNQAKELIANISDKSIETLRRFALGEPVLIDDLCGEAKPYSNLSDLKRSFVGAVNRRLRTVTGNRQAVLFLTVNSDSPQAATQIAVRQATASSLSHAFQLAGADSSPHI